MPRIDARSKFKAMISDGNMPIGTFIMSTDAAVTAIFGDAGYDFAIIDGEHGPLDRLTVLSHIRAAEANGITPIVRVLENSPTLIQSVLDVGAHGIVVPKVGSAEEARRALLSTQYAAGGRGMCQATETARWSHSGWHAHKQSSNENIIVIPLIETRAGIENFDEIAAVDGIDFIFFGLADLSQDMGIDMYTDTDQLVQIWDDTVIKAQKAGVHLGAPLGYGFEQGDFGTVEGDLGLIRTAAEQALPALRKVSPGSRQTLVSP